MKLNVLLLIALAVGLAACAKEEQAAAPTESETEAPEAAAVDVPAPETTEADVDDMADDADATLADVQAWRTEALLDHMHAHAEQLDDLNYALDDGDLFRASTSAYWLAKHESIKGLPDELQTYVSGLREAAKAVEAAEDLETAKAAAKDVGAACQACHDATEVALD